jgi:coenzyme F420-0:L-glutamate ligase/coenzyme F420-1:gamma-L-glutamate ligase
VNNGSNNQPGSQLILTALPGIPLIHPGDDLLELLTASIEQAGIAPVAGDVLVLAQKIISKAEGRLVNLETVAPSSEALRIAKDCDKDPRLIETILSEATRVLRVRPGLIVVEHRLGFICANAGIDHSNVRGEEGNPEDWVLLLPEDPDQSARSIRQALEAHYGCSLAVLIIDSHGRAWRMGTSGVAIGISGFPALMDLRGRTDIYGDPLLVTQVGLADEVAAAASILMGQADERRPAIHLRGLPYSLREGTLSEILRPEEEDLFR